MEFVLNKQRITETSTFLTCRSLCLSVSVYQSVRLSVCLSVCPSACPSICLSVCLSVCLPVCLSVCSLCVCCVRCVSETSSTCPTRVHCVSSRLDIALERIRAEHFLRAKADRFPVYRRRDDAANARDRIIAVDAPSRSAAIAVSPSAETIPVLRYEYRVS